MNAIKMRGYVLLSAAAYLRQAAAEQGDKEVIDGLSASLRESLKTAKSATWCPADQVAEIYRAIATLGKGQEDRVRDMLIECGKRSALEASNTFLRLLMKMLTPQMFAKKLPDVWARDCTGGRIEVELQEGRITNRLSDMAGFDHIAPAACGFVVFALEAMGKSITKIEVHGWSLENPGPATASFEIRWKT
jgi:hypothetical protein